MNATATASSDTTTDFASYGNAFTPSDFSKRVTDSDRDRWTLHKALYTVEAIAGAPVVIVSNAQTGHTKVNVTLGRIRQTPGYGTHEVEIISRYSDGTTGQCFYSLYDIGTIINLGDGSINTALLAEGEDRSAAIAWFKVNHAAECPKNSTPTVHRTGVDTFNISVRHHRDEVRDTGHSTFHYWKVTRDDIAAYRR